MRKPPSVHSKAAGSTTRDGPRRPSRLPARARVGQRRAVEHELVVVARAGVDRRLVDAVAGVLERVVGAADAQRDLRPGSGAQTRNSVRPLRSGAAPSRRSNGYVAHASEPIRSRQQVDEAARRRRPSRRGRWARGRVRRSWSTTVRPRHGPWVTSTSTLRCSSVSRLGVDHVGDGEGIVHWGVVMPIDLEVEPPVEGVQVGDDGAGAARLAQRLGAGGAEHRAVRDVEADHRDVEAAT